MTFPAKCGRRRDLVERERGCDAHRIALPAATGPATTQRFSDLGDLGGLEVLGRP
ncbi:hypothetical protein [Streptomyces sp. NPDC002187]|uniref:hypothetical protein n=1 Tax=Streptomyces sp. NPDC002187 TaxID=3364637 RepID=UPI0036B01F70